MRLSIQNFISFFGADFVKVLTEKMSSLEAQVKHQGFVLSNLKMELYELRKTNSELSNDLVRLRSLESCSEATNCDRVFAPETGK